MKEKPHTGQLYTRNTETEEIAISVLYDVDGGGGGGYNRLFHSIIMYTDARRRIYNINK